MLRHSSNIVWTADSRIINMTRALTPAKQGVVPQTQRGSAEGADDNRMYVESLDEHPEERRQYQIVEQSNDRLAQ